MWCFPSWFGRASARGILCLSVLLILCLIGCNQDAEHSEGRESNASVEQGNNVVELTSAYFRVLNTSDTDYERVVVNSGDVSVDYGEIDSGVRSKFIEVSIAQDNVNVEVTLDGEIHVIRPLHPGFRWVVQNAYYTLYLNTGLEDALRCEKDPQSSYRDDIPKIEGVTLTDSTQDIFSAFGDPIRTEQWEDNARVYRTLVYPDVTFEQLDCRFGDDCGVSSIVLTSEKYSFPPGIRVGQTKDQILQKLDFKPGSLYGPKDSYECWIGPFHGYLVFFEDDVAVRLILINDM